MERTRQTVQYSTSFIYFGKVLRHRIIESQKLGEQQQQKQTKGAGVTGWLVSGLTRFIHGGEATTEVPATVETKLPEPKPVQQVQQQPAPVQQQPPQQQVQPPTSQTPPPVQKKEEAKPKPQQPANQDDSGWFGGWFGKKKKANVGSENPFVYNEQLKRWIPKDANPADYAQEETAPPPPDMSAMQAPTNFDLNQQRAPLTGVASRYVDVLGGNKPATTSSSPAVMRNTPPAAASTPPPMGGFAAINALPQRPMIPSFFVPSPSTQQPAEEQQQDTVQQQQPDNGYQHPAFATQQQQPPMGHFAPQQQAPVPMHPMQQQQNNNNMFFNPYQQQQFAPQQSHPFMQQPYQAQ